MEVILYTPLKSKIKVYHIFADCSILRGRPYREEVLDVKFSGRAGRKGARVVSDQRGLAIGTTCFRCESRKRTRREEDDS